jgi:hypothetical protein
VFTARYGLSFKFESSIGSAMAQAVSRGPGSITDQSM